MGKLSIILVLGTLFGAACRDRSGQASAPDEGSTSRRPLSALPLRDKAGRSRPRSAVMPGVSMVAEDWGGLRAQAPIDLPDGGTARVALETNAVPVGGGLLVFCLVDENGPRDLKGGQLSLGPLDCRLIAPGKPNSEARILMASISEKAPAGERLYARALSIDRVGEHRIIISLPDSEEPLRELLVTGTDEPYHAWLPFSSTRPLGELEQESVRGVHPQQLAAVGTGPSLPVIDSLHPIDEADSVSQGQAPADETRLPTLMPSEVDPDLRLDPTERGFGLQSSGRLIVSSAEWHLLARWWVNDKPYSPDRDRVRQELSEGIGQVAEGNELQVELDLDPAVLNASPGDRIGLQLLYVPHGWKRSGGMAMLRKRLRIDSVGTPLPRLSNRIEFLARQHE